MTEGLPFSILVVDDDEDDRVIIDEAFLEIGIGSEIKKFINGKMLFRYLEQLDTTLYPSLIVLDNTLPELEAIDVLRILKGSPCSHIPVVIYTTTLTTSKEKQLLEAGAYACFEKGNTMLEVIELAMKLKGLSEQKLQEP